MAKAQGRPVAKSAKDVVLDTSREHPALTPRMRRLADELWAFLQAKAVGEGFPITEATLRVYTDMDDFTWVAISTQCPVSPDEVLAFEDRLESDYERWIDGLGEEHREYQDRPHISLHWLPGSRLNDGV